MGQWICYSGVCVCVFCAVMRSAAVDLTSCEISLHFPRTELKGKCSPTPSVCERTCTRACTCMCVNVFIQPTPLASQAFCSAFQNNSSVHELLIYAAAAFAALLYISDVDLWTPVTGDWSPAVAWLRAKAFFLPTWEMFSADSPALWEQSDAMFGVKFTWWDTKMLKFTSFAYSPSGIHFQRFGNHGFPASLSPDELFGFLLTSFFLWRWWMNLCDLSFCLFLFGLWEFACFFFSLTLNAGSGVLCILLLKF